MSKIKWIKFATRPTPLLERYLRMFGIVKEFKQFKSTDVNYILVISKKGVDELYVDEKEHNNLPKQALQEFQRGDSLKILQFQKNLLKQSIENLQRLKKIQNKK